MQITCTSPGIKTETEAYNPSAPSSAVGRTIAPLFESVVSYLDRSSVTLNILVRPIAHASLTL